MLEPLRSRLELILFLELLERRIVEEPQPFISSGGKCSGNEHGKNESERNHRRMKNANSLNEKPALLSEKWRMGLFAVVQFAEADMVVTSSPIRPCSGLRKVVLATMAWT